MSRGDQGADATATEEYAGARSDIDKDDTKVKNDQGRRWATGRSRITGLRESSAENEEAEPSHGDEPQAEAKITGLSRQRLPKQQHEGLQKDEKWGMQQRQGRRWSLKWQVKTSRKSRGDEE